MKGDFSKPPFDARRRFAGVLMQQGRVSLDADWNEQVGIENRRAESMMLDLIGPSGAPRDAAGYGITAMHRLDFDGVDDFVHVGDAEPLAFGDSHPLTLEAWIRPKPSRVLSSIAGRLDVRSGGERLRGSYLLGLEADQSLAFHIVVDSAHESDPTDPSAPPTRTRRVVSIRSPVKIGADAWSHVAATFDGTVVTLLVNGRAVVRGSVSGRTPRAHGPFLIGARLQDGQPTWFFHGSIADVRVWSTARTDREIALSMRHTLTGREPGLVANWRLDDGRDIVRDNGPWRCDGRLGGGDEESRPRWRVADLRIGAGRFYVDGIQCENPHEHSIRLQPDYPGAWMPTHHHHAGRFAVYLEVWRHYFGAIDDPNLREVALGGPDTTGRLRTVAQVKLVRLRRDEHDDDPERIERSWREHVRLGRGARMSMRRPPSAAYLGNNLYRVEVHDSGYLTGSHADGHSVRVVTVTETLVEIVVDITIEELRWARVGRTIDFLVDGQSVRGHRGRIVRIDTETVTIVVELLVETVDERIVPDSLHRIRPAATLKWSRDNGSIVFPVRDVSGSSVRLSEVAGDVPELTVGDWIELTDETMELTGTVGPLHRITALDDRRTLVDVDPPPPEDFGHDGKTQPRLRRWDQKTQAGKPLEHGLIVPSVQTDTAPWIDLERGIEMAFEGNGWLESGDYWMVPARTITESLEWPDDANGPAFLPPLGVVRHVALLATYHFNGHSGRIRDHRPIFHPLARPHWQDEPAAQGDPDDLRAKEE